MTEKNDEENDESANTEAVKHQMFCELFYILK